MHSGHFIDASSKSSTDTDQLDPPNKVLYQLGNTRELTVSVGGVGVLFALRATTSPNRRRRNLSEYGGGNLAELAKENLGDVVRMARRSDHETENRHLHQLSFEIRKHFPL